MSTLVQGPSKRPGALAHGIPSLVSRFLPPRSFQFSFLNNVPLSRRQSLTATRTAIIFGLQAVILTVSSSPQRLSPSKKQVSHNRRRPRIRRVRVHVHLPHPWNVAITSALFASGRLSGRKPIGRRTGVHTELSGPSRLRARVAESLQTIRPHTPQPRCTFTSQTQRHPPAETSARP